MITTAEDPKRSGQILRIALVASILAHMLAGLLFIAASDEARRLLHIDIRRPVKKPDDETVTMSTALRLEKRAKPETGGGRPKPVVAEHARPAPQSVAEVPHPLVEPKPVSAPPPAQKHELAKVVPHATSEPAKTTKAKKPSETPTAPPATAAPAKQVASLQHPLRTTQPARPSRAAQLSRAQIAKIERDLAKTIAQARSNAGPLSDTRKRTVASSVKRYAMNFGGVGTDLRRAQGLCHPVKSWQADGWNYYYDICEVQEPDGSVREKTLPWPVRYKPQADPNLGTGPDPAPVLPVPGWRPDPSRPLDPDFLPYLRANGFTV
jgi:outer membrane biosynthesis protein TonB